MRLIAELRRRQVFRTAAWYGGLAWLAIEVANTVFPQFGLPAWSVRAVIVAAVLGFPVAVVLAWCLDVTATGIRREASAEPPRDSIGSGTVAADTTPAALWRTPSLWLALVLGVGLTLSAEQAWKRWVRPAGGERPGIAVLPFANLSPDPANAFFADGLHEEILTSLARAGGLRVISRTSVQEYRDARRNLREIAEALEATHILEGSVRRDGDDLRLTVQLIDGRTDEHLWTETYDRKLLDAFQLQRTVAQQVASEIGAKLSRTEERLIRAAAPTVAEAYEPYLQALALWDQHATESQLRAVASLLDQSIAHDPGFAVAYALRSKTRMWLAQNYLGRDTATIRAARADFERALQLQPDLPEALTARGLYFTYAAHDPVRALQDLSLALRLAPNDPDSHNAAGLTLRRLARYDEALEHFREAARLTPAEEGYAYRTFETLLGLGRLDEAEQERQAFERRFPAHAGARLVRYWIRFLRTGATDDWREDYARLSPLLQGQDSRNTHAKRIAYATNDIPLFVRMVESEADLQPQDRAMDLGLAYTALGDATRARPHLELAVAASAGAMPDDPQALSIGAVALALLGRHQEALQATDRALELAPARETDVVNYSFVAQWHAWVLIYTRLRADEGYAELEGLIGAFGVAPQPLLVLPPWRLLRDDPRVQRIVRGKLPG